MNEWIKKGIGHFYAKNFSEALKDFSFVGMGATVMDDVELGEYSFVGAGSLVTPGKKIPPGVLVMGSQAKIIRDINEKEREIITRTATNYQKYKDNYLNPTKFKLLTQN